MVTKKVIRKSGRTGKVGTMRNFKISVTYSLVYKNPEAARAVKGNIQKHVPHAKVSGILKTGRGYRIAVQNTYVKKLPSSISAAAVSAHLKKQAPGYKVAVTKM